MSLLLAALLAAAAPSTSCAAQTIPVAGQPLWVDLQGQGPMTVVFESGNGNDSSVWDGIAPQVRAMGVRTFRYDRRGYGKSAHFADDNYAIGKDLDTLRQALARCGVTGPVVMVSHSYGGGLALLLARRNRQVQGIVLVDAIIPNGWSDQTVHDTVAEARPQYAEVRAQAPDLARTVIPIMEALPVTARTLNRTRVSRTLPIIDIVADGGSGAAKPALAEQWRAAHRRFVAQAPAARRYVDAEDSGHKVMRDRPDLILAAVRDMLGQIAPKNPG